MDARLIADLAQKVTLSKTTPHRELLDLVQHAIIKQKQLAMELRADPNRQVKEMGDIAQGKVLALEAVEDALYGIKVRLKILGEMG